MNKLKNISQSKKAKQAYTSPLKDFLKTRKTKSDIMIKMECGDRVARELVAECSMYYPVIAVSNIPGYRLAKQIEGMTTDELEIEMKLVQQTINELQSRIKCLKKKQKPLIAWLKVAEKYKEVE